MADSPCAEGMTVRFLRRLLLEDQRGATAIELGLLTMLIAVAIIGSLHAFSNQLNNTFNTTTNNIAVDP